MLISKGGFIYALELAVELINYIKIYNNIRKIRKFLLEKKTKTYIFDFFAKSWRRLTRKPRK